MCPWGAAWGSPTSLLCLSCPLLCTLVPAVSQAITRLLCVCLCTHTRACVCACCCLVLILSQAPWGLSTYLDLWYHLLALH